ncbi:MAG: hypothetical protein U0163_21030 [Gemmatimonadaceae bacterium]
MSLRTALALSLIAGCNTVAAPDHPTLYGAGLFSTGAWDFFMALTPDQQRAVFCVANDNFTEYHLREARRDAQGQWGTASIPSFAWTGSDADPHFSPDGRQLFFISDRPVPGDTTAVVADIWMVPFGPDGQWGTPTHLPAPINLPGTEEWAPSVAANGNLYFGSNRDGGRGGFDLYVARWQDGHYLPPESVGDAINSAADEVEPWVAPDESYMILSGRGRPDAAGNFDLYVSLRVNGEWQAPRPITAVNTPAMELNHSVSPDGQWLYFSSNRRYSGPLGERFDHPPNDSLVQGIGNGKGDIYRIPMSAVRAAAAATKR